MSASLVNRVRALHVNERNGVGPGDCHCDACCDTMDALRDAQRMGEALDAIAKGSWNHGNRRPGLSVMQFAREASE